MSLSKTQETGWPYTIAARAARATEDVMTAFLPIVLGQGALQGHLVAPKLQDLQRRQV
jgi:hypothetical protein